jgi:SAM-dependent methyltransferase
MLHLTWPADLRQRRRRPELMDQPDLDGCQHVHALRGLERINFWSGSVRILWPPILALFRQTSGRPLRLLDLASGAGDVPIGLWRRARRAGLTLDLDGWDVSPRAVAYGRARAEAAGASVRFFEADAIRTAIPPQYDVVISSLFLHHLDEEKARDLLECMARAAKRLILVNDLARCYRGYLLAHLATRLLSASRVVRVDGPRSVEGAFTPDEVRALAEGAGLCGVRVERRWPCRFLLAWERR